jgi:hypothetical protein
MAVGVVQFIVLCCQLNCFISAAACFSSGCTLIFCWLTDWLVRGVRHLVLADYCVCCADSTILYPVWSCRCLPRCIVSVIELTASFRVVSEYCFTCPVPLCTPRGPLTHVNPVCSSAQFVPSGRCFYTSVMTICVQGRNMQQLNNSIHNKSCV